MASGGSDRDAKYALSKLLQMDPVAEYHNEFEMLIIRVTQISNHITLDEAFSLARAAEARFTDLQLWKLLRSNPTTLGEAFFRVCITEARFEAIVGKELNIKEKVDTILSWPSEEAPPVVKGPLDANEDTILSLRSEDPNLRIQEKAVEYVRALNAAPLEVVFAGPFHIGVDEVSSAIDDVFYIGEARGVDGDELNRVISSGDVSGGSLVGFLKWVYREKNCEVFSVTSR
ncbi:hypothetical protein Tco_0001256 [Tanacetum coccineum]